MNMFHAFYKFIIMKDSRILRAYDLSANGGEGCSRGFNSECDAESQRVFHMLKCSMLKLALNGADKVLLDRRTLNGNMLGLEFPAGFARDHGEVRRSNLSSTQVSVESAVEERGDGATSPHLEENGRVCREAATSLLHHHSSTDRVDASQVVNCASRNCDSFPLNIVAFIMVLLIKTIGFQVGLLIKFFTFPLLLSYFSFMLLLCPFQTLGHIRGHFMTLLLRMWNATFINVTSAVRGGFKTQKSLAVNVGFALFGSIYVLSMLLGILVSAFVLSGFIMKHLVEKPIKTTETLNFDYTKPSPAAVVPLMASSVGVIPYGHKLQMTVSLTLPDSEYNHRLGVFQVRVEFLSATGQVTSSSSYPCMLQFKSLPIHYIQTFLRSAPLIAGLQSETQVLTIKIHEHTEGLEPTACLKVILEQRAEFHHDGGIPQIYAGSLLLQSELPRLKRLVWYWRRTIFVWTSILSFLVELVFILAFCRPMLIPRGTPKLSSRNTKRSNIIFRHKRR